LGNVGRDVGDDDFIGGIQ